jgi:CRISPR/Cas system-associated exonuclease Cas4 (RecB family)
MVKENQLGLIQSNMENKIKVISRSMIDLYCECPRCFFLNFVEGIKRPPGYPFTLNAAVDKLTKMEFDHYRNLQISHPKCSSEGLSVIPLEHPLMGSWRNNFRGVRTVKRGRIISGVVDDIWENTESGNWHVVDYKATAKKDPVTELDPNAPHHDAYKRQLEVYSWLLAENGLPVDKTAYLYYSTGNNTLPNFNDNLQFETHIIAVSLDWNWVDPTLNAMIDLIDEVDPPAASKDCNYCNYFEKRTRLMELVNTTIEHE